jgi:hypothetical protein
MARSLTSELKAVFSMPGLEQIAAPLRDFVGSEKDGVALVGYLAARAAMGSANKLDDELAEPSVWDGIRTAAAERGRQLQRRPPTFNKLHHLRLKIEAKSPTAFDEVLLAMNNAFIEVSVELAKAGGLLNPANVGDLRVPERPNTLYADGTWWEPLSKIRVDSDTGELIGHSRSKAARQIDGQWWSDPETVVDPVTGEVSVVPAKPVPGPRIAETLTTTKDGKVLVGIPFVMVGVHGHDAGERVVLGLRRFLSPLLSDGRGETPAADELLSRVIPVAGDGAQWLIYDMAFRGQNLHALASMGVVGVAAMPSASKDSEGLILTGDGPVRYNCDSRKAFVATSTIRRFNHRVESGVCEHTLSAVDGSLRCHPSGRPVRLDDPLCPIVDLEFVGERIGHQRLVATYEVPCEHRRVPVKIDMSGKVTGTSTLILNRLRPISEYAESFASVKGWRQDVENLNAIMKRAVHLDGQATSLNPAHFELDVLGSALWVNSKFWDVHVARATNSAQRRAAADLKRLKRQPALV